MITLSDYTSLFKFRSDTYAEQQKDGSYKRILKHLTSDDLKAHVIDHTRVLALYPSVKGKCFLGTIDLDIPHGDVKSPDSWKELENRIRSIKEQLISLGIEKPILIEKTGGRGYHIWVFSEEIPVTQMYDLLKQMIDSLGIEAEVFPIDTIEGGIGRGIRPPLGTHFLYPGSISYFVDHNFNKIELTEDMIIEIDNNRITKEDMSRLNILDDNRVDYNNHNLDYKDVPKAFNFEEVYDDLRPCFQSVYDDKIETIGGEGWSFMTAAAAEILANGGRDQDVHTYFSVQEQYDKRKTSKHLRPIKRKSLMPFTCDKLIERCGKYVGAECETCRINKQQHIYNQLEIAVDKTQGKEERTIGGVRETIEQFQYVADDIQDILTQDKYTVILNGFNTGKSWATVAMMKNIIGEGGRVNFLAHSKKVKKIMMSRLMKAGVGFLDNPNNLELCSRGREVEFAKLGYIPSPVCKNCEKRATIRELLKPIMDDYITGNLPFFGTLSRYKKIAEEYNTCAKWVYLSLLMATKEENLVILMTDTKVKHHLFIPNSPLIPILKSGTLFCTLIDQIDYVNRKIPKIVISDLKMIGNMRKLGIIETSEIDLRYEEIAREFENGDITPEGLDELQAVDELKQWVYINEEYDAGNMRRIYNVRHPEVKTYDIMGRKPMKIIMNDIFAKKINPRLYDKTIEYLRDLRVECVGEDNKAPLSFREIIEDLTGNSAILGITSTPTDIEIASSKWWASERDSKKGILNNLYEIPMGTDIFKGSDIDGRTIIYSKRNEGDYINDGEVRGNTELGGHRDNVIIESLQYPRNSEEIMSDLIQLCGGNMGKGIKVFYQGIASDALTQAAKYKSDKIYVPNPDLFTALGFEVRGDDSANIKIWEERIIEKFNKKGGSLYRHQIKAIPEDILIQMIENGFLDRRGKKYILKVA